MAFVCMYALCFFPPCRPPTYFPPIHSQPGPSYKLQTTAEKCFANKSQEAANALLSLQREPIVMPACSQPHPSEDLSPNLLQESPRGISDGSLNVSEASCSHPDLHMESLSPPVLSHCNSEGVSPPTFTSLPHGTHAYGPTTPFPTPGIGSLLTHFQPTNYSYLPFTPHELFGGSYICHICGKSYVRPATLRSHVKSHSGEKPYQCSICHKSFTQATNLTAHLRTHSGEKPFTCRVCHRGFSQSSSVTTHMRTHSGDRPYKCNVCNKGFADSSTLTKHYRTHTGEKPYQCKICEARFSQSGNLNRHMRTHRHFPVESNN